MSRQTLPGWATEQRRACSLREKRVRARGVGACSFWPTPTVSNTGNFPDLVIGHGLLRLDKPTYRTELSGGQVPLSTAVRVWTTLWLLRRSLGVVEGAAISLTSRPVRLAFRPGPGCLVSELTCNPRFYEWTMGWPTGWTAPGQPVMGFAAWLQRSRGALSWLISVGTGDADNG